MKKDTTYKSLKNLHKSLLVEYFQIVKEVSTLSFFASIWEYRDKEKIEAFRERLSKFKPVFYIIWFVMSILAFVFRIFTIKPILKLFVEAHIRQKLNELANSYIQELSITDKENRKQWMQEYVDNHANLANTLFSWLSARGAFASIIAIILAFFGAQNVGEFIQLAVKEIGAISWLQLHPDAIVRLLKPIVTLFLYYLPAAAIFILVPFLSKRILFQNSSRNIYELENAVFEKLSRDKKKEFPVDHFLYFLFTTLFPFMIFSFIAWIGFSNEPLSSYKDVFTAIALLSPYYLPMLVMSVVTIKSWISRKWK